MPASETHAAPPRFTDLIADAWPAAESVTMGGWRMRWAWGVTGRANSVIAAGRPDREIGAAVEAAEAFYAAHQMPARFQVSEGATPSGLRPLLEERGYTAGAPTDVLVAPLSGVTGHDGAGWDAQEATSPDARWWHAFASVEHAAQAPPGGADIEGVYRGTLLRPSAPSVFVTVSRDGAVGSIGQGVVLGEWLCLQCVVTLPEQRRRGGARAVIAALGRWGHRNGCRHACLAVLHSNSAAQRLYRGSGFHRVDGYAYLSGP